MKQSVDSVSRAGILSIVVNLILFVAKLMVGLSIGSLAILADAWHTLSDSLSSLVVIIGARIAHKPEDDDHPFGHQRAEWIAAVVIAVMLAMIAGNIGLGSLQRIQSSQGILFGPAAIAVTAASVIFKEALALYCFFIARRCSSESLRADAWHHRSDALSSLIILFGILIGYRYAWMDAALGLLIAGFILFTAFGLLKRVGSLLLGESPDDDMLRRLSEIADRVAGQSVDLHHVHQHVYGGHRELTMHIRLSGKLNLADAHAITDKIEHVMRTELDVEPTIHIEPLS
ncbi:cation diffusion facilitator family transporter [Spirochaeta dissipatitropha]